MPILGKLKRYLDEHHAAYEVLKHRQAFTAQEVAAAQHVPGMEVAKVVMVRGDDGYLMAVLPAPYRVDVGRLGKACGDSSLRLATEEEFAGLFPQCEPGAMPPFGNLYSIPVWVDESLAKDPEIFFNAGNHSQMVRMSYADFERLVQPKRAAFRTPG
jgi:Ala-tRNA(Pro) deacylase